MVMTLSWLGRTAPEGKVNLSSVSWIILRLLVELSNKGMLTRDSGMKGKLWTAYFPNEVPKKASFNHTLAAKAVEGGH